LSHKGGKSRNSEDLIKKVSLSKSMLEKDDGFSFDDIVVKIDEPTLESPKR